MDRAEFFMANTQALCEREKSLAYALRSLKTIRYDLINNDDDLDINIIDESINEKIYSDVISDQEKRLHEIYPKFAFYPLLFIYGIGNGLLIKKLLENHKHEKIILFESKIELLALAFHLFDFTNDIYTQRLVIFDTNAMRPVQLFHLFSQDGVNVLSKTYELIIHNEYYERERESIALIEDMIREAIIEEAASHGKSPLVALEGVKNYLANLKTQLNHASFDALLDQRASKNTHAVIVSTGPSLTKQLQTLKEYQDKITIFCADSAYPILKKYGIKPDYVLCLERSMKMQIFFKDPASDFDEGILFVLLSVVHPEVVECMKGREFILINKNSHFTLAMDMPEYGSLDLGLSVAHLSFRLAILLGFKSLTLIGQDLAYAKDGSSHPKDFLLGNKYESKKKHLYVQAYASENELVYTNRNWLLYKTYFEDMILQCEEKQISVYNATQGGAKILGSIEIGFKKLCKELFSIQKDKLSFKGPKIKTGNLAKAKENADLILSYTLALNSHGKKLLQMIDPILKSKNIEDKINLSEEITSYKLGFDLQAACKEVLEPVLFQLECDLNVVMVRFASTPREQETKLKLWLRAQKHWLLEVGKYLDLFCDELEKSELLSEE